MTCDELGPELIDYIKGELEPERLKTVETHLAKCAHCRTEAEGLKQTLAALRGELVPIELSAHFRLALADRIDEAATRGRSTLPRAAQPSERRVPGMRKSAAALLLDHARRSPYFAASLLAHAAMLALVCAVLLRDAHVTREEKLHNAASEPASEPATYTALASPRYAAYLSRSEARRIETEAQRTDGDVRVSLATLYFVEDADLVLTVDRELGCVKGYYAAAEGENSRAALLQRNPGAAEARIENATLVVPSRLAACLRPSLNLVVFSLNDRLELWSKPTWESFGKEFAAAPAGSTETALADCRAAALPSRREERA